MRLADVPRRIAGMKQITFHYVAPPEEPQRVEASRLTVSSWLGVRKRGRSRMGLTRTVAGACPSSPERLIFSHQGAPGFGRRPDGAEWLEVGLSAVTHCRTSASFRPLHEPLTLTVRLQTAHVLSSCDTDSVNIERRLLTRPAVQCIAWEWQKCPNSGRSAARLERPKQSIRVN